MAPAPVLRPTLRPTVPADRPFLLALYGELRADEVALTDWPAEQRAAFVEMQFDLQDRQYREHNPDGTFDVVEIDGVPVGRLYVDRRPTDVRIVDIALLAAHRGRGVGTALVGAVLDEARASGRSVSIHVEVHNPAGSLYERLGFRPVALRGVYRLMEWRAA